MKINGLDLGGRHPYQHPVVGQVVGAVIVEGRETVNYARGAQSRTQAVSFFVRAWQSVGPAAALSSDALRYLVRQVEELAANAAAQPVFIQWTASADPAAVVNASEVHDGWYLIEDFSANWDGYSMSAEVPCRMTVAEIASAPPRSLAMAYAGGALASNFSGAAQNILELPFGSTPLEGSFNRTHATGTQPPTVLSPVASPEPFGPPMSIANLFASGVEIYDTVNTGTNPVPTSGGTYVNANWVQVFDTHHDFQGDCVITNGLQLLWLPTGQAINAFLWNTALATANWQLWALLSPYDQAGNGAQIRSYSLTQVGLEEVRVVVVWSTVGGQVQRTTLRLQRGRYDVRVELTPLTQALAANLYMNLSYGPGTANRITYNPSHLGDALLSEGSLGVDATYGYAAEIVPSTAFPFIWGWLYQNQPGNQPNAFANASLTLGDTVALAIGASRSYGIFAVPYGVSGSYSTANLQAEGESGALGTGWSSVADAAASGGNTAKAASGTAAGNADLFGTVFSPAPGIYDIWFRVRVTTNVGSAAEMTLGLWDPTAGSFIVSAVFNRTAIGTTYGWVRPWQAISLPAVHATQFRAVTALALGTDWFIDEAVLVPTRLTADNRGPQDIWQQFMYDRSAVLVPS